MKLPEASIEIDGLDWSSNVVVLTVVDPPSGLPALS